MVLVLILFMELVIMIIHLVLTEHGILSLKRKQMMKDFISAQAV